MQEKDVRSLKIHHLMNQRSSTNGSFSPHLTYPETLSVKANSKDWLWGVTTNQHMSKQASYQKGRRETVSSPCFHTENKMENWTIKRKMHCGQEILPLFHFIQTRMDKPFQQLLPWFFVYSCVFNLFVWSHPLLSINGEKEENNL